MKITSIKRLLRDRNFIFFLSLLLGLIYGDPAKRLKDLVIPTLAIIMTLSAVAVSSDVFRSARLMLRASFLGIVLCYLFHGGLLILLASVLVQRVDLWTGFVILASVPPAVAVLPFSGFIRADTEFALFGLIGAYLAGLIVTPLMLFLSFGGEIMDPTKVLKILLELVILPLFISRILIRVGLKEKVESIRGGALNWGFFLVIYVITGLNRHVMINSPEELVLPLLLSFLSTFGFGWMLQFFGKLAKMDERKIGSMILLGTYKNYGLAAGISVFFFSVETALPSTLGSAFGIIYMIYLSRLRNRDRKEVSGAGLSDR